MEQTPQNLEYKVISDNLKFELFKLIKIHMYIKLTENNNESKLTDGDLDIIVNLYLFGGITDKNTMSNFSKDCFNKQLTSVNSAQSVRNSLSIGRKLGVIKRKRVNNWVITDNYLPKLDTDLYAFKYLLTN